jgi:organic radical activating enzyme
MSRETNRIRKVIEITNEVSPTFCLAKWHHVTMYMHTGHTHSCYHPAPHPIPLEELENNPSALHNTLQKKKERALMLVGEKPKGCQYCWNIEALGSDYVSDRHIRNEALYRPEFVDAITSKAWNQDVNPDYIEISFSSECNFKCGYCHPKHSSSYYSEIKQFGPYLNVKNHGNSIDSFTIHEEENNPWIDAWWQWWPEMSKTLNILRITGGEPLLHKSTWRLFDHLRKEPKPHLELNLNSNFGSTTRHIEKLADNVNDLLSNNKIKGFKVFSSMDTWGKRAEYLRTGLKLDLWEHNLDTFITKTASPITFMCTFNILSVTSFTDFLEKVLEWRAKYQEVYKNERKQPIVFDTPYLKEPLQYDMLILPKDEYLPYFDKILKFIDDNRVDGDLTKFSDLEYERFRRVRDYFATKEYSEERVLEGRKDFYNWFTEYDRRRGIDFLETFPEMANFFNECKNLSK